MKLSLRWLNDFVDIKDFFSRPEDLAHRLTSIGIEVEEIEDLAKKYQHVVVGIIREKGVHPNADRLSLCQVDVGDGKIRQIVCGATNHRQGDQVVVALPGAILPGDFEIKLSKIRQVESQGMLCSEVELGLVKESEGIMILPPSDSLGKPFAEYMGWNDILLKLSVTPNRSDCLSHLGLAREVAALLGREWVSPEAGVKPLNTNDISTRQEMGLEVIEPKLCPRYAGRMVFGVKVGPSPDWLRSRLEKVGINSISNVVDVTNYVMLEMGQPLHAFDVRELKENKIVVARAQKDEKFVTLDGTELSLSGEELMIRDGSRAVAMAGVVGGLNSGVTETTENIFIESAYFLKETVRKTSRKWGIETESSYRFSRGTDPDGVLRALNRACQLIQEMAGGVASQDFHDFYPDPLLPLNIEVTQSYLEQRLGYSVQPENFEKWMKRIGCQISPRGTGEWQVQPPLFRWDLEMTVDLVEEYARFHGYDQIPEIFPALTNSPSPHSPSFLFENTLTDVLVAEGYWQVVNYGFFSRSERSRFIENPQALSSLGLRTPEQGVMVKNPLSDETNEMRVSLLPGLFKNLLHNIRQGNGEGRLFEIGSVFRESTSLKKEPASEKEKSQSGDRHAMGGAYEEEGRLALLGWGQSKELWTKELDNCPMVYSLKTSIENLMGRLLISSFQWRKVETASVPNFLHPGQTVGLFVEGQMVGVLGTIHPLMAQTNKLRTSVALAEISSQALIKGQPRVARAKSFSRFPAVERDLAFLVPESVDAGDILKEIRQQTRPLLEDVSIFDVYSDAQLESGFRSIAYRMVFRDENGTLEEGQLTQLHQKVVDAVKKRFKVDVR